MKNIGLLLILLISLNSCINDNVSSFEDLSLKESNEFIQQIFANPAYDNSLMVKPNPYGNIVEGYELEMPEFEIRQLLTEKLKTKDESELKWLINNSNSFEYTDSMSDSNTKLISLEEFKFLKKEMDSIAKNGTQSEIHLYFKDLPSIYFISKPIFDKDYNTAVIDINISFTCIRSGPWIYKKQDGKWK